MPDISESTREVVKKTAAEMGYVPNYFAKSLQSDRSNILGVVVPKIRYSFYSEVIAGIESAAGAQGYELLLSVSNDRAESERRHIQTFMSMRVAGLLVSVADDEHAKASNADIYRQARARGVPLVFFDRIPTAYTRSEIAVLANDRAGARAAVSQAIERGYRKIAHIAGSDRVSVGRERRVGFEEALAAYNIVPRPEWIIALPMEERAGYQALRKLWSKKEHPDAIFFASSSQMVGAIDALRAIRSSGGQFPLLIFVGFAETVRFLNFPYICIAQPAFDLGSRAVEEILRIVRSGVAPTGRRRRAATVEVPMRIVNDTDVISPPYL